MDSHEAQKLTQDIREAFRDVTRGNGTTLHEARAMDDYQSEEEQRNARILDTDEHWQEISQTTIERLYDAFTFLDAEGLRYYLAPFLLYFLEHPESHWPVTDWAVGKLAERHDISLFAVFSERQSRVIARYLRFVSLCWEENEMLARTAVAALRKYWKKFLPEES